MIRWENLLNKFYNIPESSASAELVRFKELFKSTKRQCNDIIEISKILEKEIHKLENKLVQ
jgi:hypothetical protein